MGEFSDDVFSCKDGVFAMDTPNKSNGLKLSHQTIRHTIPDCPSYLGSILRYSHNRRRAGFIDSSNVLNRNIFYNLPGYGRWNDEIGGDKNVSGAKRDKLCRITATG